MNFQDRLYPRRGLRVVVTAGASGIGASIACAFAEAEAALHICDIDDAAMDAFVAKCPSAKATHVDVANPAQVKAFFEAQQSAFDGLDVLINCAGIAGPTAGVDKISEGEWMRSVDVNLNGQYRCLHHAVPLLRSSEAANIVCISSIAGRMGIPWRTPYVATKWAIVGVVKALAIELGPDNIRVNAILPGIVEGPRMDGVILERAKMEGLDEGAMRQEYMRSISLGRMVTADDVALMCLYLCSPAGVNVTGQAISVDGNYV